jgi:hypothetical protein
MRALALLVAIAGCSTPAPPAPPALTIRFTFAPITGMAGMVTVTTANLHLADVAAICDALPTTTTRTELGEIDLAIGDNLLQALPSPPPGLYSTLNISLDAADDVGIDVQGLYQGMPLHATVNAGPFDISCPQPVRLDPGTKGELDVSIDVSGWFDGIDWSTITSDMDDHGIVISEDDNSLAGATLTTNVTGSFDLTCRR